MLPYLKGIVSCCLLSFQAPRSWPALFSFPMSSLSPTHMGHSRISYWHLSSKPSNGLVSAEPSWS